MHASRAASSAAVMKPVLPQVNDSVLTDVQGGQMASASDVSPAYPSQRSISLPTGETRRSSTQARPPVSDRRCSADAEWPAPPVTCSLGAGPRLPEAISALLPEANQETQTSEMMELRRWRTRLLRLRRKLADASFKTFTPGSVRRGQTVDTGDSRQVCCS